MATTKKKATQDEQPADTPDMNETAAAKAIPEKERLVEDITANPPDADITFTTGTLAGDYTGEPLSGTVERTPIVGQPEQVVSDGLPEDAPRIGPHYERERQEKADAELRAGKAAKEATNK